jgi:hypothetical protein
LQSPINQNSVAAQTIAGERDSAVVRMNVLGNDRKERFIVGVVAFQNDGHSLMLQPFNREALIIWRVVPPRD